MITEWVYTINVKLRSLHARVLPVPVYRKRRCRRSLLVCISPCEVLVPPCLWKTWTSLSKCGLYVTWQTMTISEQVDYAPRDLSSQLRLKHGTYKNLVLVLWHTTAVLLPQFETEICCTLDDSLETLLTMNFFLFDSSNNYLPNYSSLNATCVSLRS